MTVSVPVAVEAVVGLNVTLIVQEAFVARETVQLLVSSNCTGLNMHRLERQVSCVGESHRLRATDCANGLGGECESRRRELRSALAADTDDLYRVWAARRIVGNDDRAGFGAG